MQECPKCHYVRKPTDDAPDWQCPNCAVAYAKFGSAPLHHAHELQQDFSSARDGAARADGDNFALGSSEQERRLAVLNDKFKYRVLAGLVAVPVFELSLYLALGERSGRRAQYEFLLLVPVWVHVLYVGAAASVGLIFGFNGITWLLGHLFMTHFENERNPAITGALWAAFGALIAIGYFASVR